MTSSTAVPDGGSRFIKGMGTVCVSFESDLTGDNPAQATHNLEIRGTLLVLDVLVGLSWREVKVVSEHQLIKLVHPRNSPKPRHNAWYQN